MVPVYHNQKGVSLVELLVSMALVSIIFTGLLQISIMSTSRNVENALRVEATAIAEMRMNEARNTPFTALVSSAATVTRNFRGVQNYPFNTQLTVLTLNADNSQVNVAVTWTYKGRQHTHSISTVVTQR